MPRPSIYDRSAGVLGGVFLGHLFVRPMDGWDSLRVLCINLTRLGRRPNPHHAKPPDAEERQPPHRSRFSGVADTQQSDTLDPQTDPPPQIHHPNLM